MKKTLLFFISFLMLIPSVFSQKKLPFSKGVNLLDYCELWEYKQDFLPYLYKYDEADFACMKSMGIDVVRLPVHFELLQVPKDTGKILMTVFEHLDKICEWAEKYQIYLVIDDHSYNGEYWANNPPSMEDMKEHLITVWTQVSSRYKNKSEYIIYEILNEPPYKTNTEWYKIQQEIVDVIRKNDKKHSIVVSSIDFSSIDTLIKMKPLKDENLIYSFHYYEPHLFSHQGATWMGEGFAEASGIPFPYDKARFPILNAPENSWFKQLITEYPQTGTVKYMEKRIKKAVDWANKNNVALWCGELGIQSLTQNPDRPEYNRILTSILSDYNIPYCTWGLDYQCGFFSKNKRGMLFPDDIDKTIVESYGFKMPSAETASKTNAVIKNFPKKPYLIYDGICGKWTDFMVWNNGNIKNTVDDLPHGDCLKITYSKPNQGPDIKFDLPEKIKEELEKNSSSICLSFAIKFTQENQEFMIHFIDSDGGSALPPWQISYTVKASDYPKNKWVKIEIPVSLFKEFGAWTNVDQKWFSPEGKFDWKRFEKLFFEFYNNKNEYAGEVYLDDIQLK